MRAERSSPTTNMLKPRPVTVRPKSSAARARAWLSRSKTSALLSGTALNRGKPISAAESFVLPIVPRHCRGVEDTSPHNRLRAVHDFLLERDARLTMPATFVEARDVGARAAWPAYQGHGRGRN